MAKRYKTTRFSIQGFDTAHYQTTEQYAALVDELFNRATVEVTNAAAKGTYNPDVPFTFADYPALNGLVQKVGKQLAAKVQAVIEQGSRNQWLFACKKNDGFINSIFDTSKLPKSQLRKMQDRNLDALSTFQGRKVDGMNLSQRVWRTVGQYKIQMESALDVGLGEGRSAQQLARDVKQNLKDPNRLFRRVRDKRGNLQLSKAAQAFHPGQGVYRSSVKNAQRLARTEINMAYRESDWARWQTLDFVVGFEVRRSNHEPKCKCDLCERLVGRYPKTFKFTGWHPQCMCVCVPILMDEETFDQNELADLKAALHGKEYQKQTAKNQVNDVPDGFKEWVQDHIEAQGNWGSTPYFIRDNFKNGDLSQGLKIKLPTVDEAGKIEYHVPFETLSDKQQTEWYNFISDEMDFYDLERACNLYGVDYSSWENMWKQADDKNEYWRKNEIIAERKRVESTLMAKIAEVKKQAEQGIAEFRNVVQEAVGWIGSLKPSLDLVLQEMRDAASEKYPNYISITNSMKGGSMDVASIRAKIALSKSDYADAITMANNTIAQYGKDVDVSKLQALVNEQRTEVRNALRITNEIVKECKAVKDAFDSKKNGVLAPVETALKKKNVEYRDVKDLPKALTDTEIIERLGGGDMTKGSCSSLAFAFAANKGGLDVLDFRGGNSLDYFSTTSNIAEIITKCGGVRNFNVSGVEMMRQTEIGKMYYLAIGRHAAVVRQVSKGKYEYLELQSSRVNGWKPLNASVFASRFSARGREWSAEMCDITLLAKESSYRKIMGYINTKESEQKKGATGTIK